MNGQLSLFRRYFLPTLIAVFTGNDLLSTNTAHAASSQQQELEEIIVDAALISQNRDRLPLAIDKLSRLDISRAQPQLGLDESLVNIPGLVLQNRFNFAQDLRISIRGFGARASFGIRGVKILVDGIPETLADGQGSVDSIDLASIGNIEVIRGPASSLYGNASGGVIHIESDFDRSDAGVEARFAAGGDGYKKVQFSANGRAGSREQLSYIVSGSDLEVDGYRQHSEHENRLFNSRMRYRFEDDASLNLSLSYTDQPVANDPGGVNGATLATDRRAARGRNQQLNAGEALRQTRLGLQYQRPVGDNGKLSIRNYHLWREFDGLIPLSGNGAIDLNRRYSGGGIRYQHQTVGDRGNTGFTNTSIIGVDFDRQDDDRKRFENLNGLRGDKVLDQNELVTSLGIYLQNQLAIGEQWLITTGLRYDEVRFDVTDNFGANSDKITLNQLSPMLGASFSINPQLNIYGTVATSFETPTTTELALADNTGLNSLLNPQQAINYELGVKGSAQQRYRYSLALFEIYVDDEIIALEDNLGRDIFVNAGESSRRGAELALQASLTETLIGSLSYTWSDFEFDRFIDANNNNFAGNKIPGLPDNLLHVELEYQNANGFFAIFEVLYVDEFSLNNANSEINPSSLVSDFRAGYRWQLAFENSESLIIEPFIGVSNLNNEDYLSNARINAFGGRYFEAGPDRNVFGGVSIRYVTANN